METRRVRTELSVLKFYQLFHILLTFLIILCHIISVKKYILVLHSLIFLFCLSLFIYFLNLLFLIITSAILFSKKKNSSLINSLRKITLRIAVISFIKGVVLTVIFWINYYYYFNKFGADCPFNVSLKKMEKLLNNSKIENFGKNCGLSRCIFNSSSVVLTNDTNIGENSKTNIYNYLCNFNPSYDIKYNKNNKLECNYVFKSDFVNTKFNYYLEQCDKYTNYYSCNTNEKRHDKFYVSYNHKCTKSLKKSKFMALGFLFPFIDAISDVMIWLFIHYQYRLIIRYVIYANAVQLTRYSAASLNSTKESSVIKPNNNNRDLITQINIHNQTETIFYPPLDDNVIKNKNIMNIIKDNKIKDKKVEVKIYNNNSSFDSNSDIMTSKINFNTDTEV